MRNQPDKIVYDSSQSQDVSFLLDYANCCSPSTFVKSAKALQKWQDWILGQILQVQLKGSPIKRQYQRDWAQHPNINRADKNMKIQLLQRIFPSMEQTQKKSPLSFSMMFQRHQRTSDNCALERQDLDSREANST